ncbi:MAG: hypothetical protein A2X36_13550 [Elusimicrobia bacterium GWA2_69_24]|nr:MAG: hypothetical protein A2X36_13550 [Elusimicrobia bacterium GWA2_69_24]HBL19038.1 hypothetical protein [Elusimicrobiota bacterium]
MAALVCLLPQAAWAEGPRNPVEGLATILCLGIGVTAFVVWGRMTFPKLARSADQVLRDHSSWKTFWIGLINAVVGFLVFVVAAKTGETVQPMQAVALLILCAAGLVVFRGALGVWPEYGHKLLESEETPSDLKASLSGGALLTGILLLFPVGFLLFGYAAVRALGTGILMWTTPTKEAGA